MKSWAVGLGLMLLGEVQATTIIGPWVPLFKGIDYSVSTNLPSTGGMPHLMVIHTLRVDLADPDIRLFTTPRLPNYVPRAAEVGGLTVSDFLATNHLQAAINANLFAPTEYYLPAGTPMDIDGLAISQGVVVSTQDSRENSAAMVFDANNRGRVIGTNWPAVSTEGIYTAVSGTYPLLIAGKNVGYNYSNQAEFLNRANPRTAFGLSEDSRYLYLMAIDGRQPGYSEGAFNYETGEWLLLLGATDAINLDGGGSTVLAIQDSTGFPVRLNKSSAVADSGRERTVGSHLGVFAKPLPGFINDVQAIPDDTTTQIIWTTTEPASSQVQFGTSSDLDQTSPLDSTLATEHRVRLTGLSPATGYYYRILSATSSQSFVSSLFYFVTTNYVTTNQLFDLDHPWKFSTTPFTTPDWTTAGFDDSDWGGPGPGLLWVDVRATGPNPEVNPKVTPIPVDSATGYPYRAYYCRTHFTVPTVMERSTLLVTGYIDDGAIFYLNGTEVFRLRMPTGAVTSQTLAKGYPCDGDANCLDQFSMPADALVAGDNILAVEIHNYNARSADITFGIALSRVEPMVRNATLQAHYVDNRLTLTWDATGAVLQTASALDGAWSDVAEASQSPYVTTASDSSRYYRLRR